MTAPTAAPIEVLLATHNGAQYLPAQLQSLLDQTSRNFSILASDDRSSDDTPAILARFADEHPRLIRVLEPAAERCGASANFARLLDTAQSDYVMFCDQDDIWLPDKIERTFQAMTLAEAAQSPGMPVMVHTDLRVVDDDLRELGSSFVRYAGIDPARKQFAALLLGNIATGCTIMANRALYALARPVPPEALMYDHWLAQVAAGLGQIVYLDEPTVFYRQHLNNTVGARRAGTSSLFERVDRTLRTDKVLRVLARYTQHAEVLERRFGDRLEPRLARQCRALAGIWNLAPQRRFVSLLRAGLSKPSLATNAGLFALVLRDGRAFRLDAGRGQ